MDIVGEACTSNLPFFSPPSKTSTEPRFSVEIFSSKLNLPFLISVFWVEAVAGVDSQVELRLLNEVLIFS